MGATLLGTAIEWYDFGIYIFAASLVFPQVFFPNMEPGLGILSSFATLAIAGITRPLGAIIFGHIGDRVGRKRALVLSLSIMTIATLGIGLLPSYAQVGGLAVVLLFTLRVFQSVAVGGEWGGATLYAVECAPPGLRALYGSFPQIGNGLGLLLSTGMFTLLTREEWAPLLVEWTWRIPFLVAGALGIVGIILRLRIEESPIFQESLQEEREAAKESRIPIVELLRDSWRTVLQASGAALVTIAGLYVIVSYITARGASVLGFSDHQLSAAGMMVSVSIIILVPLSAWAADVWGVRRVAIVGLALHLVVAFPMLWLVETGTVGGLWAGMFLGNLASSIAYAVIGTLIAGWFAVRTRQSGLSLAYQLAGVVATFTPFIAQWLDNSSGGSWVPVAVYFLVMAAVSLACVLLYRRPDLIDADLEATDSLEGVS